MGPLPSYATIIVHSCTHRYGKIGKYSHLLILSTPPKPSSNRGIPHIWNILGPYSGGGDHEWVFIIGYIRGSYYGFMKIYGIHYGIIMGNISDITTPSHR
jgi:hypothetical protein